MVLRGRPSVLVFVFMFVFVFVFVFVSVFVSVAVTGGAAWQAECQSCPLISQECPTPAPGPSYYLHSGALAFYYKATCLLLGARSVEMWAGRRPNSLPTPVSELSITKPTLGSLPRALKQPLKEI